MKVEKIFGCKLVTYKGCQFVFLRDEKVTKEAVEKRYAQHLALLSTLSDMQDD